MINADGFIMVVFGGGFESVVTVFGGGFVSVVTVFGGGFVSVVTVFGGGFVSFVFVGVVEGRVFFDLLRANSDFYKLDY